MVKFKRIIVLLMAAVLLFVTLPFAASADEIVVYNGNLFAPFAGRTKQQIADQYAAATMAGSSYRNGDPSTYYKVPATTAAPYAAGELTADTHTAMTAMTNYYRWLVGVDPLQSTSYHTKALQEGALIRNWDFNHAVSYSKKPSDMSDELWNSGAGASHNILSRGTSPRGSITNWLNEGYRPASGVWDTIGHRTALLNAYHSEILFGYAGTVAIGKYTKYDNNMNVPFAAYPAVGLMPEHDIYADESAWSIQLNTAVFSIPDYAALEVAVTNLADYSSYVCTSANGKLQAGTTMAFVQPAATNGKYYYAEGSKYLITVSGLREKNTGKAAQITYTVEFFDVTKYAATRVYSAKAEGWDTLNLPSKLNNTAALTKLISILPKNAEITGESGRTVTVPIVDGWKLDASNKRYVAKADATKLPSDFTDSDNKLREIVINYKFMDYTGSFGVVGSDDLTEGTKTKFAMWRYMLGYNNLAIYQMTGASTRLRFTQDSTGYSNQNGYDIFEFTAQTADSGEWYALYYNDSAYWREAYLAGNCSLKVNPKPIPHNVSCPSAKFKDAPKQSNWAHEGIDFVVSRGLFSGTDATHFEPETPMTRAMLVTVLWRYCGSPSGYTASFADLKENWYKSAVSWAASNGIVNGVSKTKFAPNDAITREQLAAIMKRFSDYRGKFTGVSTSLDYYPDASQISSYARVPMQWALASGLIAGTRIGWQTYLDPKGKATRAQVATILMRYIKNN